MKLSDKDNRFFYDQNLYQKNYKDQYTPVVFEDIGTYYGELYEGAPEGVGQFIWLKGDQFIGQWKDGNPTYGICKTSDEHWNAVVWEDSKWVVVYHLEDWDQVIQKLDQEYLDEITFIEQVHSLKRTFLSFILSVLCCILLFDLHFTVYFMCTILIHELGHAMTMKIFQWKSIYLNFIGPLGAYAIGKNKYHHHVQDFLIYLMGPLPGIIIGIYLFFNTPYITGYTHHIQTLGLCMLLINTANLIPVSILDGGRILQLFYSYKTRWNHGCYLLLSLVATVIYLYYMALSALYHWRSIYLLEMIIIIIMGLILYHEWKSFRVDVFISKQAYLFSKTLQKNYMTMPTKIDYTLIEMLHRQLAPFEYSSPEINRYLVPEIWKQRSVYFSTFQKKLCIAIYLILIALGMTTLYARTYGHYTVYYEKSKYIGQIYDGVRYGYGDWYLDDGTSYHGFWKDDQLHGWVRLIDTQQQKSYDVQFDHGKLVKSKKDLRQ